MQLIRHNAAPTKLQIHLTHISTYSRAGAALTRSAGWTFQMHFLEVEGKLLNFD